MPPTSSSYVEAITPNVTLSRDRVYKEVSKVKRGHKAGALIQ